MTGILQNAFCNPAYVNQTNLNGKLRKNLEAPNGGPSKNLGGAWPTQASPENSHWSTHALSTSRKDTTGFLAKSFEGCCVFTVLTAACYCMAVKSLYSYSEVCVRVGRVKSRPFTVGVGLLQACVLSPLFFMICISGSQWRS